MLVRERVERIWADAAVVEPRDGIDDEADTSGASVACGRWVAALYALRPLSAETTPPGLRRTHHLGDVVDEVPPGRRRYGCTPSEGAGWRPSNSFTRATVARYHQKIQSRYASS